MAAWRGDSAAGREGDMVRRRTGEGGRRVARAWAPAGCGELAKTFGEGGGWPERAGDGEPGRCGVARRGGGATVRESRRERWEEVEGRERVLPWELIDGSLTVVGMAIAAAALAVVGEERPARCSGGETRNWLRA